MNVVAKGCQQQWASLVNTVSENSRSRVISSRQWILDGKLNAVEDEPNTGLNPNSPEARLAAFARLSEARQIEILAVSASAPLDPQPLRTKGRPIGSKNKPHNKDATSTRRDPSRFGHVAKRAITCSACGGKGHRKDNPICPSHPCCAGPSSGAGQQEQ
ncbi:hypothetical protein DFS34DRAFT_590970 [Phlyctochytrium arcticum]|nr:hypothetical protein DFS34DRAFT_590970 [Phlyctochytrium arcticum]